MTAVNSPSTARTVLVAAATAVNTADGGKTAVASAVAVLFT
jgi:hypothetical protein